MPFYNQVYEASYLPELATKVAWGEVKLDPYPIVPFISDGFPPALIPLWSTEFSYYGFWKHWFCDRAMSLVFLPLGDHFLTEEFGRTFEQFCVFTIMANFANGIYSEDEALKVFRKANLNDEDFQAMLAIVASSEDDPAGLLAHPRFREDPPLACFSDPTLYRGDFPVSDLLLEQSRTDVCGFEVSLPILQQLDPRPEAPWLTPPDGYAEQRRVFRHCLDAGDLSGAWMSLNSPAWLPDDARKAMLELAERAGDPSFTVLARAWVSERQGVLA